MFQSKLKYFNKICRSVFSVKNYRSSKKIFCDKMTYKITLNFPLPYPQEVYNSSLHHTVSNFSWRGWITKSTLIFLFILFQLYIENSLVWSRLLGLRHLWYEPWLSHLQTNLQTAALRQYFKFVIIFSIVYWWVHALSFWNLISKLAHSLESKITF